MQVFVYVMSVAYDEIVPFYLLLFNMLLPPTKIIGIK